MQAMSNLGGMARDDQETFQRFNRIDPWDNSQYRDNATFSSL
jgi:hypothetical protein